jgi:CRISPR-associated protein Cmr1
MKTETFHLELITPCFCAGAEQAVAEIRAASIRGQLRWWFRAMGGNPRGETSIFGSTAVDSAAGSLVRVAVSDVKPVTQRSLPVFSPNDAQSYVWHYASVSGTTTKGGKGPRWQPQGALPAGTTFNLHVTWLRELPNLKPAFADTITAFLTLGALGLRATRGLGAFHCAQIGDLEEVIALLERKGFTIKKRSNPDNFPDYTSALKDWASWLRYRLRKEHKAAAPSPLGSSSPRQASAVHFRPFRISNNRISWLAFEPPSDRVLGQDSRRRSALLTGYNFSGPAPCPEARA